MSEERYLEEFSKLYQLKKKELVKKYMKLIYTEEELHTNTNFGKFLLREKEKELMRYNKSALAMWIINELEKAIA